LYTILPYRADQYGEAGFTLWQSTLGETWPLTRDLFDRALSSVLPGQRSDHFIAMEGSAIVGFVATQINQNIAAPSDGYLMALIVAPDAQRRGIGTALHNAALDHLRQCGVRQAQLGGRYPRFWPGVPSNLPLAVSFFKARGWTYPDHIDYDLTRNLDGYTVSPELHEQMAAEQISIGPATAEEVEAVLAFEEREFAGWLDTFRYIASLGDYQDMLVARDPRKGIVGTLNMFSPQSNPQRVDALWKPLLGDDVGGLGEVGVAASERKRGIGVAMVAWGSEILRQRGVGNAFIGYTSLVNFYGKVGYKVWRRYEMSRREL
jgi:beta-N-acetylhexosaminidase